MKLKLSLKKWNLLSRFGIDLTPAELLQTSGTELPWEMHETFFAILDKEELQ